jgi:hypothetical protein
MLLQLMIFTGHVHVYVYSTTITKFKMSSSEGTSEDQARQELFSKSSGDSDVRQR